MDLITGGAGFVRLFRSDHRDYAGERSRDFAGVGDRVDAALWALLGNGVPSDLHAVGSGTRRSFRAIAETMLGAMGGTPDIRSIDPPEARRGEYRHPARADLARLRAAGFGAPTLEDGSAAYHTFPAWHDRYR